MVIYEVDFANDKMDDFGKKAYADGRIKSEYFENDGNIKDSREDFPFKLEFIKILNNHTKTINNCCN